jgi:hypothetical protein
MAFNEDIIKLRKRVLDAVSTGVIESNLKDFYEATLLQIMNESEKHRQNCAAQAEALRKQASVLDGQASGYSSMSSIIYGVLNGYIMAAEKAQREEDERAAEKAEKQAYADAELAKATEIGLISEPIENEPVEEAKKRKKR